MSALISKKEQEVLRTFIPWNTLPVARFEDICAEITVEEHPKGTVLFEQGDDEKEFVYLISGMISLFAGEMEMETIVTGSEAARFAIAHHIPRKVKAITKSKVRLVRLATYKLDVSSPKDSGQTYTVSEDEEEGGDWMMTMLQSPVFQRLPASNLQKIMMQMEEISFEAGDTVVNQGDEADYYYIIKSGDCELIRQASAGARPIKLAELHSCEAFGEDALLSGNPRNVTVKMKGKGQMLRLSKQNFISLVKEPVLQYVSFDEGLKQVNDGANWLDVRSPDVYEADHIDNSVNIPFFSLRMKVAEIPHDQLQVLVCDNGRTSEAAAFLLLKFGFNALILKGGMQGLKKAKPSPKVVKPVEPVVSLAVEEQEKPNPPAAQDKNAIELAQHNTANLERERAEVNEKLSAAQQESATLLEKITQKDLELSELQLNASALSEQLNASKAEALANENQLEATLADEKKQSALLLEDLKQKQRILDEAKLAAASETQVVTDALAQVKRQLEQVEKTSAVSVADKDEQIKALNEQSSELTFKLAVSEEAKAEVDSVMQAKLGEFESTVSANDEAIQQYLAEIELKQTECVTHAERVISLESELEGLVTDRDKQASALRENQSQQGMQAEELAALQANQREQEAARATAKQEYTEVTEQLLKAVEERDTLQKGLAQAEEGASEASDAQSALNTQLLGAEQKQLNLREELGETTAVADNLAVLNTQLESRLAESDANVLALQQSAETVQHELSSKETSLSELTESKDSLEQALTQQITDLALASDEAVVAKDELERRLFDLQKELAEQQSNVNLAEQKRATLESELAEQALKSEEFEASQIEQRAELEQTLTTVKTDQQNVAEQLAEVTSAKSDAEAKLQELQEQLIRGLDGHEQLSEQLSALQGELDESVQEREGERLQHTASIKQSAASYQELEQSFNEQRQQLADAEADKVGQREELEQALTAAKADQQSVERQLVEETSAKSDAEAQLQERQEQLNALQDELDESVEEHEGERLQYAASIEQSAASCQELEQALTAAKTEHQGAEDQLTEATSAKSNAEAKLQEHQEQLIALQGKLDESVQELEAECLQHATSIEQSAASCQELDQALTTARTGQQELEQQLAEVANAKSGVEAKLYELQEQLARGLDGHEQLSEQMASLQRDLEQRTQEREDERVQHAALIEQLSASYQELERSFNEQREQFADAEGKRASQCAELEQALTTAKVEQQGVEQQLVEETSAKSDVEAKLQGLQEQLARGVDGHEQLSEQLSALQSELDASGQEREDERLQHAALVEQASASYQELEQSFNEQRQQLTDGEAGQAAQHVELEQALVKVKADHQGVSQQLADVMSVKSDAEAKLQELQEQLASGESGHDQLLVQLKQAQEELEALAVKADEERSEMLNSLQKSEARYTEAESTVADSVSQGELDSQRLSTLEQELLEERETRLQVDHTLALLQADKDTLQLNLSELEATLLSARNAENSLQDELEQVKKASVESSKSTGDRTANLEASEQRYKELSASFDAVSAERLSDDRLFKRQLVDWDARLQRAEDDKLALEALVEELKASQLVEPVAKREVDDGLTREVAELKVALGDAQQKSEKDAVAIEDALKDKSALDADLKAANSEVVVLQANLRDLAKQTESAVEDVSVDARVIALEAELDVATTQLLDMEIKLETSSADVVDTPSVEDVSELKALQSELSLVREQTEKDVSVMQSKLENSEKMNLALKKKLLSMQALANQEAVAVEEPKEKKKGWWKK